MNYTNFAFTNRRIIFYVLAIICSLYSKAQLTNLPTGNWQYVNGLDTITMYFKNDTINIGGTNYPTTIGFHTYKKGNTIIESSMQFKNSSYLQIQYSIILNYWYTNKNIYLGFFSDISLNTSRRIYITLLSPSVIQVRITTPGERRKQNSKFYTLPRNFTLTKGASQNVVLNKNF